MGNIHNFNFNKLDLKLSNSDFWDFYLGQDEASGYNPAVTSGDCLVVLFDFNNPNIYVSGITSPTSTISSLVYWTGATNTGYTFDTIGLTGIDNGLITFQKDPFDTTNSALLSALTGTTLVIPADDKRLHLNPITGTTGVFIYPIDINADDSGQYAQLCGGFYQGYYKIDGSTYQVLPTRVNKAWVAQFWLKSTSQDCDYTGLTLNQYYTDNDGFFFYMGTRAENKFWNYFGGVDTGCTSACTVDSGCTDTLSEWCTIPKETNIYINTTGGTIPLTPHQTTTEIITNQFLIYGRSSSGGTCSYCGNSITPFGKETVCSYSGDPLVVIRPKTVTTNTTNPFLVYGRSSSGGTCSYCGNGVTEYGKETVCSFSGFEKSIEFDNLDYNLDIIDNALGFRITSDGRIGYRLMTVTGGCQDNFYTSGVTISEGYSASNIISGDYWTNVVIRFTMDYLDDCDLTLKPKRKGKLMFYINGKLKYVVNNFDEFIGNRLNDYAEKQVGVPFNMSLGGGSQGLVETQTFDGIDQDDLGLPIEQNFAGTFIGAISTFKFNICDLYFSDIQNIYNQEVIRYRIDDGNFLLQEDGFFILQEDNFKIIV
jgi:hypothetical protein